MAGERTPLFASNAASSRAAKRAFLLKIGAGAVLVAALASVYYATSGSSSSAEPSSIATTSGAAPLTEDNWFCGEANFEADYIKLTNKKGDDEYFYWYVPSRSENAATDPLVLWLTGGPGGSSIMAMLTENGPCMVKPGVKTEWNRYAWNNNANVLWLDQPSGVAFSAFDDLDDTDFTEKDVGANIYNFLNGFLDKHPEFVGRDFYITGESYGGHYIPGASHYVWQQNKANVPAGTVPRINLKGIAIGNGLTNPNIQYLYNQDMTGNQYNIPLLTDEQAAQMKKDAVECISLTEQCQKAPTNGTICKVAQGCWGQKLIAPFGEAHVNMYDMRQACPPENLVQCGNDYTFLDEYFQEDVVKKHLGVAKHTWIESNPDVNQHFVNSGDWSFDYHQYVADLLDDGLRVLIYAGDADLMCNWIGNRAWTLALEWKGKSGFNAAPEVAFKSLDPFVKDAEEVDAGVGRQYENFAFLRLYNSGHMVPMDQPAVSWVMLDKFLRNEPIV